MLKIIRLFFFGMSFILITPIALLFCLIRPFHPDNIFFFATIWGPVAKKILGIEIEVQNHHHMKDNRPCVFIMNHQSNFDIVLGGAIRVRRTVSLGKREIIWFPLFGLFYWLSGNILIKREKRQKALQAMDKVNRIIREKNISILIMPEGTRSKGKGLAPFKKGAFRTAIGAQVPIVPICASSWHKYIDLNRWKAGKVLINVLPPISTKEKTSNDINEVSQICFQLMNAEINRLDESFE